MAAYLCKFPNCMPYLPVCLLVGQSPPPFSILTLLVCPDPAIAREGKHMLERTKDILSQSVNVWPLAARWLESVEKLSAADQKGSGMVPSSHEGGMAEGVSFLLFVLPYFAVSSVILTPCRKIPSHPLFTLPSRTLGPPGRQTRPSTTVGSWPGSSGPAVHTHGRLALVPAAA